MSIEKNHAPICQPRTAAAAEWKAMRERNRAALDASRAALDAAEARDRRAASLPWTILRFLAGAFFGVVLFAGAFLVAAFLAAMIEAAGANPFKTA